jgi:malic enzyme
VDKGGLLNVGRTYLMPAQRTYAQPDERVANWPRTSHGKIGLADVIGQVEATVLIGLSTVGGAFTESIVREMARKVERQVIFPLSNPTTSSEASPEDLICWKGVATHSISTRFTVPGNLGFPGPATKPVVPIMRERLRNGLRCVEQRLRMRSDGAADA